MGDHTDTRTQKSLPKSHTLVCKLQRGHISHFIRLLHAHFNPGSVELVHKYPLDSFVFATLVDFRQLMVELLFRLADAAEGNEIGQASRADATVIAEVLTQAARPHSDDGVIDRRNGVIKLLLIHVRLQACRILFGIAGKESSVASAGALHRRDDNASLIGGREAFRSRAPRKTPDHGAGQ